MGCVPASCKSCLMNERLYFAMFARSISVHESLLFLNLLILV